MRHRPLNHYLLISKTMRIDKWILIAIYSLFLLLPWYHHDSGQWQTVDIAIAVSGLLLILRERLTPLHYLKHSITYMIMCVLGLYLIARYGVAYLADGSVLSSLLSQIYYLALLTLFAYLFVYLYTTRPIAAFYQIMLNCLFISTLVPLAILIIFGKDYKLATIQLTNPLVYRPVLSFNNANQLGFFALINLSIFIYLTLLTNHLQHKTNKLFSLIIININLVFLFLSASRGAAPAILLYYLAYLLIFKPHALKKHPLLFLTGIILLSGVWFFSISFYHHYLMPEVVATNKHINVGFMQDIYVRSLQGIHFNLSSLTLTFFGSASLLNPLRTLHLEYHNNFTSLFNQAGLLGLFLYLALIFVVLGKLLKKGWVYVLPFACYVIYSELHYAYRARINWLFFAMIIFILLYPHLKKREMNIHDDINTKAIFETTI